jgi:hypothetical protein
MSDTNPIEAWGGGGLAGFSAFVRAIRTPQTPRGLFSSTLTGVVVGLIVFPLVKWWRPEETTAFALLLCAACGFISAEIVVYSLRLVEVIGGRLMLTAQQKIDNALPPPPPNGNNPPAAPPPTGPVGHG